MAEEADERALAEGVGEAGVEGEGGVGLGEEFDPFCLSIQSASTFFLHKQQSRKSVCTVMCIPTLSSPSLRSHQGHQDRYSSGTLGDSVTMPRRQRVGASPSLNLPKS